MIVENEMLTYTTMSDVVEFVKRLGATEFKKELKQFNNDIYEEIFFPQTESTKCFLTNRK